MVNFPCHSSDMDGLRISHDTSAYEVPAALDGAGRLTAACIAQALAMMDTHGLVVITGLLSNSEAEAGLALVHQTIADPDRARSAFASETEISMSGAISARCRQTPGSRALPPRWRSGWRAC